jgi:hypothetical protein
MGFMLGAYAGCFIVHVNRRRQVQLSQRHVNTKQTKRQKGNKKNLSLSWVQLAWRVARLVELQTQQPNARARPDAPWNCGGSLGF